jgi:hypothetical protein
MKEHSNNVDIEDETQISMHLKNWRDYVMPKITTGPSEFQNKLILNYPIFDSKNPEETDLYIF